MNSKVIEKKFINVVVVVLVGAAKAVIQLCT